MNNEIGRAMKLGSYKSERFQGFDLSEQRKLMPWWEQEDRSQSPSERFKNKGTNFSEKIMPRAGKRYIG